MNICHGKRSCNIAADKDTFGSPCRPESRMYLKVVYTCGEEQLCCNHFIQAVSITCIEERSSIRLLGDWQTLCSFPTMA